MIDIFVTPSDNAGYIWNAEDWLHIREKFRIVGQLIGSLANYPRQDTFFGLPMILSAEEITLLKEKNLARLVYCPSLFETPCESLTGEFSKQEKAFHESQKELYLQRNELKQERRLGSGIESKQNNYAGCAMDIHQTICKELDKTQGVSVDSYLSCITTGDSWIEKSDCIEAEWTYPNSEIEFLKYDVFKDLWNKNYYLTSGAKFGGDFLCYLGDPVKFHACFIVICITSHSKISPKDIITYSRIGSSTRKTVVLATKNENTVAYQSLQWIESHNEIKLNAG